MKTNEIGDGSDGCRGSCHEGTTTAPPRAHLEARARPLRAPRVSHSTNYFYDLIIISFLLGDVLVGQASPRPLLFPGDGRRLLIRDRSPHKPTTLDNTNLTEPTIHLSTYRRAPLQC